MSKYYEMGQNEYPKDFDTPELTKYISKNICVKIK